MPSIGRTYHCVCGRDVALGDGEEVVCQGCGRRPGGLCSEDLVSAVTVAISGEDGASEARADGRAAGRAAEDRGAPGPSLTGKTIDHFEVLEEIGRGGAGTVYRALDRSLERYVALKILDPAQGTSDSDAVESFVHEARAQARVSHPAIATIYYIGAHESQTYFALELLPGPNLEVKASSGPLSFREVVEYGLQVVDALKDAQERGVIHRDIKPGNIILGTGGRVKLTDFGLSKTETGGLRITGSRNITGTPYYIAPEQARGETTDHRTDIYSLGATLYHLAYGRPPFEGDSYLAVISKHLSEPVRFPESAPPDVSPGFPFILERMMAKDPARRFSSYDELARALREIRPESQVVAAMPRRAIAALLDTAIGLFAFLLLWTPVVSYLSDEGRPGADRSSGWTSVYFVISANAVVACLIGVQTLWGSTPGKLFARLRIVRTDGLPLERWKLAARGLLQFLPLAWPGLVAAFELLTRWGVPGLLGGAALLGFAIDHLWALRNKRRQTLHDRLFGTWVLDRP